MTSGKRRALWKGRDRCLDDETTTHRRRRHHCRHQQDNNADTKAKKTKSEGKNYSLMTFDEVPEYMKDNEFIRKYYRGEWPLKQVLFSLFQWHNETLNIWTHLLGFALFLGLIVVNLVHVPQVVDLFGIFRSFPKGAEMNVSHDSKSLLMGTTKLLNLKSINHPGYNYVPMEMAAARWPFYIFLSGSVFCLLSSSLCHLFSCHSYNLSMQLLRMDYVGISVMIITSFFPPIYYIFQCEPHWQIIYLSGITLMGTFTVVTLYSPTLSSGKYRGFRAILFTSMGLFGLIPAVHTSIMNWDNPKRNMILAYELFMALFYLAGTGFYVTRIPERFKPGWFDIAGHSHQIFHVFVIMGALAHYGAALIFLDYRDIVGCDSSL
ncbi:hypothetical protein Nepgr_022416 [Nepenthes gracilis]|uniref:Heptahelical transmembrane protein 1-like n=1 Tax=Nepenthes gracilis TaxID=150966 RepID=A0AAD3T0R0_NEPGR|nr:hypothetical protein Nepgr_022416 [Nepenthes gracilis]